MLPLRLAIKVKWQTASYQLQSQRRDGGAGQDTSTLDTPHVVAENRSDMRPLRDNDDIDAGKQPENTENPVGCKKKGKGKRGLQRG